MQGPRSKANPSGRVSGTSRSNREGTRQTAAERGLLFIAHFLFTRNLNILLTLHKNFSFREQKVRGIGLENGSQQGPCCEGSGM